MKVLVTDGEQRAALALVRSLGAKGFATWVTSPRRNSLAGASRFAAGAFVSADPLIAPSTFGADISAFVRGQRIDVVIPTSEAALLALLPLRDDLHPAIVPFPDATVVSRMCDKHEVLDVAARIGLTVPRQTVVASRHDAVNLDRAALPFPMVVKPSRSVGLQDGIRNKLSVSYALNEVALERQLRDLPDSAFPVLLQQQVVGPGVGIFALIWNGELLACFSHRRIREKPPSGGVSVYRESIPLNRELVDLSVRLLEQFQWHGVAMIEFKVDATTGTPYVMEVNPRFWGSLQLAVDAGVDFPAMLVRAACGETVEAVTTYAHGVRSRWWFGDVDHLLAVLRRQGAEVLHEGYPSRARALREFLRVQASDSNEVFRWSDPWPGMREAMDWVARR